MDKYMIKDIVFRRLKKCIKKTCLIKSQNIIDKLFDEIYKDEKQTLRPKNNEYALNQFITSKKIEGASDRTIKYYLNTLKTFILSINKVYYTVNTDDIRNYLDKYKSNSKASNITIDNVRRVISSFFCWLENEDYIIKSPTKRIHKVKILKKVKEILSDEEILILRKSTTCVRDTAIINLLYSTGIRIGELVRLNIDDIDLINRECIVLGKGNKQRKVYFDTQTKIDIQKYISNRGDNNEALFVSKLKPYKRLNISGVEILLRNLGKLNGIKKVHPHKFRRTIATKAIDKGMPIEQVQHMLGHAKIDTTLEYAIVDDENVKNSHKKYLE